MRLIPVIVTPDGEEIIIPGLAEIVGDNWIHKNEVDFSSVNDYESIWEKGPNGKWRTICKI